jgi:hypothetical protein
VGFKPSYDIVGNRRELKDGARLIVMTSMGQQTEALGDIVYRKNLSDDSQKTAKTAAKQEMETFQSADVFDRPLKGTSGGAVLTDRSELIGIEFKQGDTGLIVSYDWDSIANWVANAGMSQISIGLKHRSRSAPVLRPGNVEISVALTSMFVPQFGWLTAAPNLRLATTLPNMALIDLAFDFTFSQATKVVGGGSEALSITVPAITGQFAVGSTIPYLRTKHWLGGLYVASGVAPVFVNDTLRSYNVQTSNIRAWSPVFDTGWRYRMPGRQWGFNASYREGIMLGSEAQNLYPRFRSATAGLFVLFR